MKTLSFKLAIAMAIIFVVDWFTGGTFAQIFGVSLSSPIYTWITYAFIHGSILHLAFNMMAFLVIGPAIERNFGQKRFILFSLAAALASGLPAVYLARLLGSNVLLIGYSGVIFAYLGLLVRFRLISARDKRQELINIVRDNAFLVFYLIFPFIFPSFISGEGHLMGLLFGVVSLPFFLRLNLK